MANEDIYRVTTHMHGPQTIGSFSIYYQEVIPFTHPAGGNLSLADSYALHMLPSLLDAISNEWEVSGITVEKITGGHDAKFVKPQSPSPGTVLTPALPGNNAILISLTQINFPKTSNGRIYIPGLAEADTDVGLINSAWLNGPGQALVNAVATTINEDQGGGTWIPGVISQKVLNANPPAKDWDAAFSPLAGALVTGVIARQVRRTTKVIGGFA